MTPGSARSVRVASGAVREHLIELEQAVIDVNTLQALERKHRAEGSKERRAARKSRYAQAAAGASGGLRPWLLRLLSAVACKRLAIDIGIGVVCAAGLITLAAGPAATRHALAVAGVAVLPGVVVAVVGGWVPRWSVSAGSPRRTGWSGGCARPESGNDNGRPDHPDEPPSNPSHDHEGFARFSRPGTFGRPSGIPTSMYWSLVPRSALSCGTHAPRGGSFPWRWTCPAPRASSTCARTPMRRT